MIWSQLQEPPEKTTDYCKNNVALKYDKISVTDKVLAISDSTSAPLKISKTSSTTDLRKNDVITVTCHHNHHHHRHKHHHHHHHSHRPKSTKVKVDKSIQTKSEMFIEAHIKKQNPLLMNFKDDPEAIQYSSRVLYVSKCDL